MASKKKSISFSMRIPAQLDREIRAETRLTGRRVVLDCIREHFEFLKTTDPAARQEMIFSAQEKLMKRRLMAAIVALPDDSLWEMAERARARLAAITSESARADAAEEVGFYETELALRKITTKPVSPQDRALQVLLETKGKGLAYNDVPPIPE